MTASESPPLLALCFPCYNEEALLPHVIDPILAKLGRLIGEGLANADSFVLFVNDGSTDHTWSLLKAWCRQHKQVRAIKQARNAGHQNAILCGMLYAKDHAECVITMDADLQDDLDAVEEMLRLYREEGCEIVYGIRQDRSTDSFFKQQSATAFYRLMHWLGTDIRYNHADFRLVGKKALEALAGFREVNLFLRGIFPLLGFQTGEVRYDRKERGFGTTKYPLSHMVRLAWMGIVSLTSVPLRLISGLALLACVVSFALVVWVVVIKLSGRAVTGWASLAVLICFFGAVQLLSLSILGEYLSMIFLETKGRPRYIIAEILHSSGQQAGFE